MDNSKFYEDALETVKQAVDADNAKDYDKAYGLYMRALDRFVAGLRFEKDPTRKKMIEERSIQYMDRAEALKKMLDSASKAQVGGGSGGATLAKGAGDKADGGSGGDKADDAEASKLKGALAGAIIAEKPNVKWDDVAGLEAAKDALKEAVILPARFPQLFTGSRKPWKGILLYGPPGTGKSYLAKAVATEANSTFFSLSSSDLVSKWQGESERLVKNLFEMARERKPAVVFIDEIDSLCGARGEGGETEGARRIKTEFLTQMQGVGKNMDGVLVLGATNTPWEIDAAMRRRFEKRIYIPLPERHARAKMFKIHIGDTPAKLSPTDFDELGGLSDGFSGSDVSVVVREALMEPLRKCKQAQFFRKEPASGMFEPVLDDPPCSRCPLDLASRPAPRRKPCANCGAERCTLYELASAELKVPDVTMEDFRTVLHKTKASVAQRELVRFDDFTREFGEQGSA